MTIAAKLKRFIRDPENPKNQLTSQNYLIVGVVPSMGVTPKRFSGLLINDPKEKGFVVTVVISKQGTSLWIARQQNPELVSYRAFNENYIQHVYAGKCVKMWDL